MAEAQATRARLCPPVAGATGLTQVPLPRRRTHVAPGAAIAGLLRCARFVLDFNYWGGGQLLMMVQLMPMDLGTGKMHATAKASKSYNSSYRCTGVVQLHSPWLTVEDTVEHVEQGGHAVGAHAVGGRGAATEAEGCTDLVVRSGDGGDAGAGAGVGASLLEQEVQRCAGGSSSADGGEYGGEYGGASSTSRSVCVWDMLWLLKQEQSRLVDELGRTREKRLSRNPPWIRVMDTGDVAPPVTPALRRLLGTRSPADIMCEQLAMQALALQQEIGTPNGSPCPSPMCLPRSGARPAPPSVVPCARGPSSFAQGPRTKSKSKKARREPSQFIIYYVLCAHQGPLKYCAEW
jgi:hypothetical protein